MAWSEIVSNLLKLATYWFDPKERRKRKKRQIRKKIANLRDKQIEARKAGDELLWNQLNARINKLITEAMKLDA